MRSWLPILVLAAPLLAFSDAQTAAREKETWRGWDQGLREANASQRPVLVDVYTDWCGWCKRMDRDVYSRSDIREYLSRRFVTVKLNAESPASAKYQGKTFTSRSLAARFRVNGYPTTIFLRPGGEHLANVPGYLDGDRFLLLLHYVGDGHLDRGVTFDEFVKQSSAAAPGGK
jgi:thioredoxin-related protein